MRTAGWEEETERMVIAKAKSTNIGISLVVRIKIEGNV